MQMFIASLVRLFGLERRVRLCTARISAAVLRPYSSCIQIYGVMGNGASARFIVVSFFASTPQERFQK